MFCSMMATLRCHFITHFLSKERILIAPSELYNTKAPFELVHADVADIRFFFSRSVVNPKYCLCVDLFSSKVYVYPTKKKSNLAKILDISYEEIEPKRKIVNQEMRLQTDLEFSQREIIKLNRKYHVLMFSTKVRGGKEFAADQKIREFKKLLLKSKRWHKATTSRRLEN